MLAAFASVHERDFGKPYKLPHSRRSSNQIDLGWTGLSVESATVGRKVKCRLVSSKLPVRRYSRLDLISDAPSSSFSARDRVLESKSSSVWPLKTYSLFPCSSPPTNSLPRVEYIE